jgi:hypothetical protein
MSEPAGQRAPARPDPRAMLVPDTTAGSFLHRIVGYKGPGSRTPPLVKPYLASVALTYLPLLIAAWFSGTLAAPSSGAVHSPAGTLYFIDDLNIAFAFLVSFPMLVWLLVTDESVLAASLRRVQEDGVLNVPDAFSARARSWKEKFRKINICAQLGGIAVGLALCFLTLQFYLRSGGFWIGSGASLLAVGYVYLYCITLLYALIFVYVARCIAIALYLRDLVAPATIRMLPLHPDRCGGLRPVAELGLRNQYTVSILGLNVAFLTAVSYHHPRWKELIAAATVAYLILSPVVFIGPLLPFRNGMRRTKAEWMREIAQRLRVEFERLRLNVPNGDIRKSDEKLIDRLRKIGAVIEELPVWPFDARTLRRFGSAYGIPLLAAVLPEIVVWFGQLVMNWFSRLGA